MNWMALLAVIVSLVVMYLLGAAIYALFKKEEQSEPFYDTFVSLVVGFLAVTTIYANVKTGGNTILCIVVVAGMAYLLQTRKKISFQTISLHWQLTHNLLNIIVLSALFLVYYLFFASKTPINYIPHFDDVYYTFLSSNLGHFGSETANSVYDGNWHNATPYHYVELWFLNLLVSVFKTNPMFTYAVVERTIGVTLLATGMMAVARHYSASKLIIVLGIFALTICPFLLDYSIIEQKQCLAYRPLGMFMYCLYIWSFILYFKKNPFWFYPILIAPVFHLGSMPVIYSSIVTFALIKLIIDKDLKHCLHKIVPTVCFASIVVLFYFVINSTSDVDSDSSSFIEYCLQFYSVSKFGNHLYMNLANYAMFVPYMLPLIVVCAYGFLKNKTLLTSIWNEYKNVFLFFCISTCFGLIYGYFSYPIFRYDADQLHTLVNIPFLCILSFIALLTAITSIEKTNFKRLAVSYTIYCLVYSTSIFCISRISISYAPEDKYDSAYIDNVSDYYNHQCTLFRGGHISSESPVFNLEVPNGYLFTPFCLKSDYMYFTNMNTYFPNDSTMYAAIEKTYGEGSDLALFFKRNYPSQLQHDPFACFADQYISTHGTTTIDTLQLEFIKKYELGYLLCDSKTELPDAIVPLVDTIFIDSKTGEQFAFLKKIK